MPYGAFGLQGGSPVDRLQAAMLKQLAQRSAAAQAAVSRELDPAPTQRSSTPASAWKRGMPASPTASAWSAPAMPRWNSAANGTRCRCGWARTGSRAVNSIAASPVAGCRSRSAWAESR